MSLAPRITALNMRLISGNGIIAIADLQVAAWGVTLLRCFWKRERGRDRVGLPCNGITFHSDGDDRNARGRQPNAGGAGAVASPATRTHPQIHFGAWNNAYNTSRRTVL